MTYAIDAPTLEAAMVRHCSPTLAALKPASLFTFPGRFVPEDPRSEKEVAVRRRSLCAVVAGCNAELRECGIAVRVLAWRSCGALVYVYRPAAVAAALCEERVAARLRAAGYDPRNLPACLAELGRRLEGSDRRATAAPRHAEDGRPRPCPCARDACAGAFPHEVGFFLGYPYADVTGFIDHEGRDYVATGLWKVYADRETALATFARYRRCTSAYETAYRCHGTLSRLAVAAG